VPPPPGSVPPPPAAAADEPAAGPPPSGDSRRGVVIGIVVAILVGVGIAGFFALRDDESSAGPPDDSIATPIDTSPDDQPDPTIPDATIPDRPDLTLPSLPDLSLPDVTFPGTPPDSLAPPGSIPEATETPDGLGDDATLDGLAQDCFDGTMQACDDLYDQSESGSEYRRYGDTCAGRQPEGTAVYCRTSFPS
jgi:hypothetical protein